jgi:hypothetical protein
MPIYDASNSRCRIYVRRAGLLGAVGHDLELQAADYRIDVDEAAPQVRAEFSASSLRVVEAVEGRELRPGRLSPADKTQIERNIADAVLEAVKYPKITFRTASVASIEDGYHLRGQLSLHGRERVIEMVVRRRENAGFETEVSLLQPDFGIQPFRALAGALRVRPEVLVCVELPAPSAHNP